MPHSPPLAHGNITLSAGIQENEWSPAPAAASQNRRRGYQALLRAFNNHDNTSTTPPISPFSGRPNFPLLQLGNLPCVQDECPTPSVRSIVERLEDANRPVCVPPTFGDGANQSNHPQQTHEPQGEDEALVEEMPQTFELVASHAEQTVAAVSTPLVPPTSSIKLEPAFEGVAFEENDLTGSQAEQNMAAASTPDASPTPAVKLEAFLEGVGPEENIPGGTSPVMSESEEDIPAPTLEESRDDSINEKEAVQDKYEELVTEDVITVRIKEEVQIDGEGTVQGNEHIDSMDASQEGTGDGQITSIENGGDGSDASGQSGERPQRTGRRGVKRGRCEVERTYWLRSQKPPSSSKKSRRTKYWLRP